MALIEQTLFGTIDKVAIAIDRIKTFEPPEGYYLGFSGGKDSQCVYHLAKEAGVKFDAHYHVTGVDPPELVYFIRNNYPDVHRDPFEKSMWQLIVERGIPPTRVKRYCCDVLKERRGVDRVCLLGIRWAESEKRRKTRSAFEVVTSRKENIKLFDDNMENRQLFENCTIKGKRIVNPIIDWETEDVWEYIKTRKIEYCELYDKGFDRMGCIGCPMAGNDREKQFEYYPKFYQAYLRTFKKMLEEIKRKKGDNYNSYWKDEHDVMKWWLGRGCKEDMDENIIDEDQDTFL